MKISLICTGDKVTGTTNKTVVCWLHSARKKNKGIIFSHQGPRTPWILSPGPKVRKPCTTDSTYQHKRCKKYISLVKWIAFQICEVARNIVQVLPSLHDQNIKIWQANPTAQYSLEWHSRPQTLCGPLSHYMIASLPDGPQWFFPCVVTPFPHWIGKNVTTVM